MQDPARIDVTLAALRAAWVESPDLRLGQLIVNAVRPSDPCPEVFYAEDEALLRGLADYRKVLQLAKTNNKSNRR